MRRQVGFDAERWRLAAAGSRSEARAEAGGSRLQRFVRRVMAVDTVVEPEETAQGYRISRLLTLG